MQRFILIYCCVLLLTFTAEAQHHKQLGCFSQFQQYYNPSLTGFNGSAVKTLYRNQWTGFEDAPKTLLATAELDLKNLKHGKGYRFGKQDYEDYLKSISARHALGIAVSHDKFGPSKETALALSYGAGIRISETLSLRWGTALTYQQRMLDGNSLSVDQENDPRYANMLGRRNRMGKVDLDVGLALSAAKFYVGYALQNASKGKLLTTGDDYLDDFYTRRHMLQAGFRTLVSSNIGVILSGNYQYDTKHDGMLEGQLKAVYRNMFWAGGGYRNKTAYSLLGGVRINQLNIHYTYESPVADARYMNKVTNEIALSYTLRKIKQDTGSQQLGLW